jgi:pimeloyl-ACP methyl ester carboxylesterase
MGLTEANRPAMRDGKTRRGAETGSAIGEQDMSNRITIRTRSESLASHILPVSGTMIGVCVTLIGMLSTIPLFLAQGTTDDIVAPDVTRAYMQRQCKARGKVSMMWVPGAGHGLVARDGANTAVAWMMDRFAGRPAPSDCGKMTQASAQ